MTYRRFRWRRRPPASCRPSATVTSPPSVVVHGGHIGGGGKKSQLWKQRDETEFGAYRRVPVPAGAGGQFASAFFLGLTGVRGGAVGVRGGAVGVRGAAVGVPGGGPTSPPARDDDSAPTSRATNPPPPVAAAPKLGCPTSPTARICTQQGIRSCCQLTCTAKIQEQSARRGILFHQAIDLACCLPPKQNQTSGNSFIPIGRTKIQPKFSRSKFKFPRRIADSLPQGELCR